MGLDMGYIFIAKDSANLVYLFEVASSKALCKTAETKIWRRSFTLPFWWSGKTKVGVVQRSLASTLMVQQQRIITGFLQKKHSKQLKLVGCLQVTGAGLEPLTILNKLGKWDMGDVRRVDTHVLNIPIGGRKVCWWRWCWYDSIACWHPPTLHVEPTIHKFSQHVLFPPAPVLKDKRFQYIPVVNLAKRVSRDEPKSIGVY